MSGDQLNLDAATRWFERCEDSLSVDARLHLTGLLAEVRRLRRWKDEALPVMDGLQELGGALGLPLGSRITGRQALDAAMDLHNEVRQMRAQVARHEP